MRKESRCDLPQDEGLFSPGLRDGRAPLANRGAHAPCLGALREGPARGFAERSGAAEAIWWLVADAFYLPFAPESFAAAVDYGLFHHVKVGDQARYVAGLSRVMAPRGFLVLSVFSTNFRHHPGEVRHRSWTVHRDHYDRFFEPGELAALFSPAFSVEALVEEVSGHEAFHHALFVKEAA